MRNIVTLTLLLIFSLTVFSGSFTVINTNNAGSGSLRQAIINASSGDSINFDPNLIAGGNDTITLTSGEIAFSKDLIITGLITTTDTLFVSGNNLSRVFYITGGTILFDKMAIINGKAIHSSTKPSYGGGIFVSSSILTITNSLINKNFAKYRGGGIYAYSTTLNIKNSLISGNSISSTSPTYSSSGGGIYASLTHQNDSLSILNSTINNNTVNANEVYGGGLYIYSSYTASLKITIANSNINENNISSPNSANGGGIYTRLGDNDSLKINNSNISRNSCYSSNSTSYGGGLSFFSSSTTNYLNISQSTISENIVTSNSNSYGGGVSVLSNSSSSNNVEITKSTINSNSVISSSASSKGGGVYIRSFSKISNLIINNSTISHNIGQSNNYLGGGIYIQSSSLRIGSSIVALNTGANNINGSITTSNGYNIFGDRPLGYNSNDLTNVSSTDLNLGVLKNNGGSTFTVMPRIGSVAINMGNPNDTSDAQNIPIIGRRDVGAAESRGSYTSFYHYICQGNTYVFNSHNLTVSGVYYDTLTNVSGFDSIIKLTLVVNSIVTPLNQIICEGDSLLFGGNYYKTNGNYSDTLTTTEGCDSTVVLTLFVNPNLRDTSTIYICYGSWYSFGGNILTSTGNYSDTNTSLLGCDSITVLILSVNSILRDSISATICQGSSYNFDGIVLTTTGIYNDTAQSSLGCDSIITLSLSTINLPVVLANNNIDTINVGGPISFNTNGSIASNYLWRFGDGTQSTLNTIEHTYNTPGSYTVILQGESNTGNCISYDTLIIVVLNNVGINENIIGLNFSVYPNPNNGNFYIKHNLEEKVTINVLDINGKIIRSLVVNSNITYINLNPIEKGIYIIKILDVNQKIIFTDNIIVSYN